MGALVTGVAGCLLAAFVALAVHVHLAGSRLDSIEDPPRALTLIVERTMDLDDALTRAAMWERRFYELTVTDGRNELDEAIAWYEELSDAIPGDPGVQVRLAVLYGEAGRIDEVLDTVERWRARGDSARARALTAAELIVLGLGLAGLVIIFRGRPVRVDSALVPPPWRLGEGLVVLVRGAGGGVLVLVAVYFVGRWRGPNDPLLATLSMPLMYAPLLWLARRRLFAPAGVGLARGLGWVPAPGGWRALASTIALLVGMGTATDLALGFLSEATHMSAHWTEWFDEDLAWGGPLIAGASLLGTVVF